LAYQANKIKREIIYMKEVKTPLYLCAANNSPFDLINKGK
jgi:hypothetical protein